jgi:hypothetical protein
LELLELEELLEELEDELEELEELELDELSSSARTVIGAAGKIFVITIPKVKPKLTEITAILFLSFLNKKLNPPFEKRLWLNTKAENI